MRKNDDGFMFFGSVRHLSRTFQYGDKSSWSRNINLLAALGFVMKVPLDQIPKVIREKIDAPFMVRTSCLVCSSLYPRF
jgi:hypothetical protein